MVKFLTHTLVLITSAVSTIGFNAMAGCPDCHGECRYDSISEILQLSPNQQAFFAKIEFSECEAINKAEENLRRTIGKQKKKKLERLRKILTADQFGKYLEITEPHGCGRCLKNCKRHQESASSPEDRDNEEAAGIGPLIKGPEPVIMKKE